MTAEVIGETCLETRQGRFKATTRRAATSTSLMPRQGMLQTPVTHETSSHASKGLSSQLDVLPACPLKSPRPIH